ncbi:MAG: hypothetical protein V1944_00780 [Candidatus Aenigmatarchaeota archaeon]
MNKKQILIVSLTIVSLVVLMSAYSLSTTGFLSKAFSKTIYPGQTSEQNITVRKYYNMTIRFRTALNGSDLTFDDSDANITTKDYIGNQINFLTGINDGKIYVLIDKADIDRMSTISVEGTDKYENVANQSVIFSFSGTKAYLTVLVTKRVGNGTLVGYVYDDLTGQSVGNLGILAYEGGSEVNSTNPVSETATNVLGKFQFSLLTDAEGKSYDVYVREYTIS